MVWEIKFLFSTVGQKKQTKTLRPFEKTFWVPVATIQSLVTNPYPHDEAQPPKKNTLHNHYGDKFRHQMFTKSAFDQKLIQIVVQIEKKHTCFNMLRRNLSPKELISIRFWDFFSWLSDFQKSMFVLKKN